MGWVKSMPGDVGDFSVNIGLGINFLAGGTFYLNSNDTLSYSVTFSVEIARSERFGEFCQCKNAMIARFRQMSVCFHCTQI